MRLIKRILNGDERIFGHPVLHSRNQIDLPWDSREKNACQRGHPAILKQSLYLPVKKNNFNSIAKEYTKFSKVYLTKSCSLEKYWQSAMVDDLNLLFGKLSTFLR